MPRLLAAFTTLSLAALIALPGASAAASATPIPTVQTAPASSISGSYVTLNANVASGVSGLFAFQYGTTTDYGQQTPSEALSASTSVGPETATIPVNPGTVYHYRIVASNKGGTAYGADEEFATPPDPPRLGFGTGGAGLPTLLRNGLPVLVALDSPGTIDVSAWINTSVALARGVIGHEFPGAGALVQIASGSATVGPYAAQLVTLQVTTHAYRLLRRLKHLTVTIQATATANGVQGDSSSRTIVLAGPAARG